MTDPAHHQPSQPILLCTDGSDAALAALRSGLSVVDRDAPLVLVTVLAMPDVSAVTGTGFAGGVVSPETFERENAEEHAAAAADLDALREALGLSSADHRILEGDAGTAICDLAREVSARAIVMGTRGHSGLRRAVLGSVSDHVVREAPCPVVVAHGGDGDD